MSFDSDISKYETKNWLAKWLIQSFRKKIADILLPLNYKTLHEVGCGEGYNMNFLWSIKSAGYSGSDISVEALVLAKKRNPGVIFLNASIYQLPFLDASYDLVVASEVLEHVSDPEVALKEIKRITNKYCLLTVPNEPYWRILNILRGKYLLNWGNPPTHLQHWSVNKFTNLVSQYFKIIEVKTSLPWQIILVSL